MKKWWLLGLVLLLGVSSAAPRESKTMLDLQAPEFFLTDSADGSTETTREVARRYGIEAVPTTYFLDANGVVRRTVIGGMNTLDFRDYLREIGIIDLGR
jgi:thioredoxin-related protein